MSLKQLTDLNPGFNRWATDPKGSHTLVMPEANAIIFKRGLKKLPKSERVSWHREVVGEGETIFSIAHKYQTSVELVRKVNHLVTNTLSVGQVLLVPSGSSKVSNLVLNNERHFIESHYNQPTLQITRHEVKKGETLSQIAKKYHVKVSDIRFWNSLPGNTVDPGTSLVIWPPHARHQSYYKQPTMLHYRVRPGESLWDVAIRYNVHVDTLAKLNHAENGVIRPDQIILVPIAHHYSPILPGAMHHGPLKITNYTVQPGDSIFSIAKKHSMSRKDLLQLNKLKPNAILKPKQTLKVY